MSSPTPFSARRLPYLPDAVFEQVRSDLSRIPGVARALLDDSTSFLALICDVQASAGPPIEAAARAVLSQSGIDWQDLEVMISFRHPPEPIRRVRLAQVRLDHPQIPRSRVHVVLEWQGQNFEAVSEGGSSHSGELRLSAEATIRALEEVLARMVQFSVVGAKETRIFDEDLVVVLLQAESSKQQWTGVSRVVDGDHMRAAAAATLNALNRFLGNYLVAPS